MRVLTDKDVATFRAPPLSELTAEQEAALLDAALPERVLPETTAPDYIEPEEEKEVRPEDLAALGAAAELEEADAPAPAPAAEQEEVAVARAPPAANTLTFAVASPGAGPPATNTIALEPADATDEIPFEGDQSAAPVIPVAAAAPANSINVQTNQPVMVIPMNVSQPPAATEIISPPAPGAPTTIAVDTSENAMKSIGLPAVTAPGNARSRANSNGGRSRSNSPGAAAVSVNKVGSANAPPPAANVRVNVNKMG